MEISLGTVQWSCEDLDFQFTLKYKVICLRNIELNSNGHYSVRKVRGKKPYEIRGVSGFVFETCNSISFVCM